MTVDTTFLPKTNGLVFGDRLVARSDKGRVFGLGVSSSPLALVMGSAWVTGEPFLEAEVVTAATATYMGGEGNLVYRHRLQTRVTGGDGTITNGSWTTYDNTRQNVNLTLPSTGVDARFHSQGKDDNGQQNSFTGWRAVNAVDPLTSQIGTVSATINDVAHSSGGVVTLLINDPSTVVLSITGDASPTYTWEARNDYPLMVGGSGSSVVLTFPQSGAATVTCSLVDNQASDSPLTYAIDFFIVDAL